MGEKIAPRDRLLAGLLDLFMRYPDGTAPPRKEGNIKIMDYFFEYVGKVRSSASVLALLRN